MFRGRADELRILKRNCEDPSFRMVVLYGRRRVGKSFLLQHFLQGAEADVIAFQAIEHSKELSIEAFKDALLYVYPSDYDVKLDSWKDCFRYLNGHIPAHKLILCIDEVNYIFREDESFASILQEEIDHHLRGRNVLLVVCGSNISSIEHEIYDSSSPLYGRRDVSIQLKEFDYKEAAEFYRGYSSVDKIIAYAVFGGKGKYLAAIDPSKSVKENIINQILTPGGALADEIDLLLKDDFRETHFYKELLYALSLGKSTFNEIKESFNEESSKVATYLARLVDARIVEKVQVNGAKRKDSTRYFIQDNFLSFYFRFVYKRRSILHILVTPETFYERFIEKDLPSFVGLKFEAICESYLASKSRKGLLPFLPISFGKRYGKRNDGSSFDIDVCFEDEENALAGECKFTNRNVSSSDIHELIENASTLGNKNMFYYLFCKSGVDDLVRINYPDLIIVSPDDLYE